MAGRIKGVIYRLIKGTDMLKYKGRDVKPKRKKVYSLCELCKDTNCSYCKMLNSK
jgi:hypothetical protein